MANLSRTIELVFAGIDNTGPAISSVGNGISSIGQGVQQATQPLADLSSGILLTTGAITALGVAALTFSASEAISLQNSFIELNKVLAESEGQAEDYADVFADISNRFGIGQADVISLAADFRQAGFDIEESLGLVTQALTATAISELDVDQAGSTVIRTLNGFQAPASEAGRLIDILNSSSNNFATSFGELGEGFARLSPIARQLGFTFEETAGLLVPVIEVFGSGSEAANGLRTSLLKLGSDSAPVLEALESVGIDTSQITSARDRLAALTEVFPTLNSEQQIYVTQAIAGIEQASRFSIVLSNQETVLKATQNAYRASGAAAAELEIALASTEIALQRYQNSFLNIAAAIGTQFLPQLSEVANSATTLNTAVLDSLSGENFTQLFDALRGVFTSLRTEIDGVATAFPAAIAQVDFSPILEGLDAVSSNVLDLFGDIDLSTPQGLAEAIQFVVDSLGSLAQTAAGIISQFDGIFAAVFGGVEAFNNLTTAEQQAAGEALGVAKILNQVGGLLDTVGTVITGVGTALGVLLGASGLVSLGTLFTSATSAITTFSASSFAVSTAFTAIGASFSVLASAAAALAIPVAGIVAIYAELENQSISGFIDETFDLSRSQEFAAETAQVFGRQVGDLLSQLQNGTITTQQYNQAILDNRDQQILSRFATQENTAANRENAISLLSSQEAIDSVRNSAEGAVEGTTDFQQGIQAIREQADAFSATQLASNLSDARSEISSTASASEQLARALAEQAVPGLATFGAEADAAGETAGLLTAQVKGLDGQKVAITVDANTQSAEENLKRLEGIFSSIETAITSTGTTLVGLGDLFGSDFNNLDIFSQSAIREAFEDEARSRRETIKLQNELVRLEIRLQTERLRSIERGDAAITIDTTGIQPVLDLLLTTIIQEAQVRASIDGASFLVGAL